MFTLKTFLDPPKHGACQGPAGKRELVQAHFDAVARHYDLANTIMSLGMHLFWKKRALALLGPEPGQRLADICGGTADLALLRPAEASGGVTAVYDLNQAMLDMGRAKARRRRAPGLGFVRGDALALAFKPRSLDGAMVGFGMRNLDGLAQGFSEIARALKPGGRLVCLEFSRPPSRWFARLYDLYSCLLMPLAGRVFTGSWQTYSYLAGSIRTFPEPRELSRIISGAGFSRVSWQRLSGGIAAIHSAVK